MKALSITASVRMLIVVFGCVGSMFCAGERAQRRSATMGRILRKMSVDERFGHWKSIRTLVVRRKLRIL